MSMKSLVNFCIGVAVVILVASFLLSAFTPKAPDNSQKLIPLNQAGQVMAQTATANQLHPVPVNTVAPPSSKSPTPAPTPRNANIIEQIVMNLLSPSSANTAGSSAAQGSDNNASTLVNLDQILAAADGKKLDQLFAGATTEQKQMIRQYSGGKSDAELVSSFCRDVKSDSFKSMSASVKANSSDPNKDPHSPALLMLLFEKLATLCP